MYQNHISLIGFVVLGMASSLRAEPACSALDLKGNYSFSEDGTIFIPLGGGALARVADVEVGTLSFDGRGGMEGQIFRLSFTSDVPIFGGSNTLVLDNVALSAGQYTINSDCTYGYLHGGCRPGSPDTGRALRAHLQGQVPLHQLRACKRPERRRGEAEALRRSAFLVRPVKCPCHNSTSFSCSG